MWCLKDTIEIGIFSFNPLLGGAANQLFTVAFFETPQYSEADPEIKKNTIICQQLGSTQQQNSDGHVDQLANAEAPKLIVAESYKLMLLFSRVATVG